MLSRNHNEKNPFQITTPEDLSTTRTVELFVNVFTDFPKVIDSGHMFLTGPRGVGKSMMFRYLQADCQCLANKCKFNKLPFIGIYIPIKNESFVKAELKRLDRHASEIFNEHLMVSHFCIQIYDSFLKNPKALKSIKIDSLLNYYKGIFTTLFAYENIEIPIISDDSDIENILNTMVKVMTESYMSATQYCKKISFTTLLPEYNGPLLDYQDFLVPLISTLKDVDGFPNGTIYLLVDDAHFLTDVQTRILNSWIATRTSRKISLKVSTQYNYKNYYTVTGATIDYPHDYSEIDMATVYTSNIKTHYNDRIKEIVERRLKLEGIDKTAEEFFPEDVEQEREIKILAENYRKKHDEGGGRGHYRSDDAIRYSRPDFIKDLAGLRKASSSYSYAGFSQLVHISSGGVRYFLEAAHIMYSNEKSVLNDDSNKITYITPKTQNAVVRAEADKFLFIELEKYKSGDESVPNEDIEKLSNLIQGLGGLFRQILRSERSERRVFSISIYDTLSPEVEKILNLGVNLGFFHRSTIGRKDKKSGGRTKLYVINKRLSPIWTLDPTGFAGYLSMTNKLLEDGIKEPLSMLRRIDRQESNRDDKSKEPSLFDDLDENSGNYFEVIEGEEDD